MGKVVAVEQGADGGTRIWILPPRRFLQDLVAKGAVAVDGVSLAAAELLRDRFSVALVPETLRRTTLDRLGAGDVVNLESDVLVKIAREGTGRIIDGRGPVGVPWAGERCGSVGVEAAVAQFLKGGGVVVHDPARENEADVIFAGATFRPESMVFLLTQACGHTTVPCSEQRLADLRIPIMPGTGDPLATAYHNSVDLATAGTGVSAHERSATIRRLASDDATPDDFRQPGHVFPLAGRPAGLAQRRGHTEAALALCKLSGMPEVAVINEMMGPDGHMLTGGAVERFALRHRLPMVSIDELALSIEGAGTHVRHHRP